MINQMNLITKSLLGLFLLCFVVSGYTDASNYVVGDVFESKKRTSSVVLYELKNDLLTDIRRDPSKTGVFRQRDSRYTYDLQKGDKIILLKSFEKGNLYRVALVPKRESQRDNNTYYYVVPAKFNQLVFVEHLTD